MYPNSCVAIGAMRANVGIARRRCQRRASRSEWLAQNVAGWRTDLAGDHFAGPRWNRPPANWLFPAPRRRTIMMKLNSASPEQIEQMRSDAIAMFAPFLLREALRRVCRTRGSECPAMRQIST